MNNVSSGAKKHLLVAQLRQKSYADTKWHDVLFEVGFEVLLSIPNTELKMPSAKKLIPRWIGPFEIYNIIGGLVYNLKSPKTIKIHNVFHVSLLKPYKPNDKVKPMLENHDLMK